MTDLLRQEIATAATTIVVKVGTRVLAQADGTLNLDRISQLGEELHHVLATGRKVVLVSSGAVGAGMGRLGLADRPTDLSHLQAVAAVGQSALVDIPFRDGKLILIGFPAQYRAQTHGTFKYLFNAIHYGPAQRMRL